MNDRNILFFDKDLDSQLCLREERASGTVDQISKDQFLISSDEELIEYVVSNLSIAPLILHEDKITMNQNETQVDVSGDYNRGSSPDRRGPFYIPGTHIDINIPFAGEEWIFRYRTNPYGTIFPRADINRIFVYFSFACPHDVDPQTFKNDYEREMKLLKECVERSQKQVEQYNQRLQQLANKAINHRRERLNRHAGLAALLDIPIVTKSDAPPVAPVRIFTKKPSLPVPPKSGLEPEPGISDIAYEQILQFIRHQGRTFERTPATYSVHGEEDLRNIVLAALNGQFKGDAVGEAFRERGKTDICIEQDNRAAFVAECKLWTGPAGLTAALDQLLGYLTWRDSKSALIVFNFRNKEFSKILEALPVTLRKHRLFVRDIDCDEAGEWRMQMRSAEDEGRRIVVHVFVFNLFHNTRPRVRYI